MTFFRWQVDNFKNLRRSDVELRDINLLIGENSVGKSSLIQSIVSLNQHLRSSYFPNLLTFSGPDLDIGLNSSYIGEPLAPVSFKWVEYRDNQTEHFELDSEAEVSLEFNPPDESDDVYLKRAKSQVASTEKRFQFVFEQGTVGGTVQLKLNDSEEVIALLEGIAFPHREIPSLYRDLEVAEWFSLLLLVSEFASARQTEEDEILYYPKEFGEIWDLFLDELRAVDKDNAPPIKEHTKNLIEELRGLRGLKHYSEAWQTADRLRGDGVFAKTFENVNSLREIVRGIAAISKNAPLIPTIDRERFALEELYRSLALGAPDGKVFHLGPIRAITPRQQEGQAARGYSAVLGVSAENLAFELSRIGMLTGLAGGYVTPEGLSEELTLLESAELWMEYLGIPVEIRLVQVKGLGPLIEVNGKTMNQVGSGISQLLPVVVLCLIAGDKAHMSDNPSLVLLEQPELHLHPSSQALLADMFAKFAENKVKFLVETHSEYIVTRLRLLALRKETKADVNLIFAESDGSGGASLRTVEIDDRGRSEYWPKGFMEQVVMDRVTLAGLQFLDED